MGEKQIDIINNRPTLSSYNKLNKEDREQVEFIIKEALNANSILRVGKKKVSPKINDLWMLSWSDMVQLKEWATEGNLFETLSFFYGISERQFANLDLFNCFAAYKWINDSLIEIQNIENQELSYDDSISDKQAGAEMLNEFGYYVSLDTLAGGDILKYDDIMSKPYAIIFRKLCLDSTKSLIQKRYMQNANRKV